MNPVRPMGDHPGGPGPDPSTAGEAAALDKAAVLAGDRCILGELSLAVGRGEHWAVLGPNGSGKTTLLSLLGAERQPSRGTVRVLGERLGRVDLRELRRRIGTVGHKVAERLPLHATALEVVLTGRDGLLAPWWGTFSDDDRAEAKGLLGSLGCGAIVDQPLLWCSQGERQRVLIGRSLFGRHELLLLDEAAVGVDLPGREALVGALESLFGDGAGPTTVQVAHTLEELPAATTHALLLRAGGIVAAGRAEDVLASAPLSACFGHSFEVERRRDGRYTAFAVGSW